MQSYHTVKKKKKKNSTSEYENNTRKWLLRAWWDLWWKPLKWVKFLLGPLWTVHCAFFLFIHSNTSPYNTSPHICNHFSVWHTILSFQDLINMAPNFVYLSFSLFYDFFQFQTKFPQHIRSPIVICIAKCYSTRVHTH